MSATLHFEEMAWPNPVDPGGVEHALRYGSPSREQLLVAASFMAAYRQLERDGHRCVACGDDCSLDVHHHTYERIGQELLSDVVTLCVWCHRNHHRGIKRAPRAQGTEMA